VRSLAPAHTLSRQLEERLAKAEAAVQALTPAVGRGNLQITGEEAWQRAVEAVWCTSHVDGLLTWTDERAVETQVRGIGCGRGGAKREQEIVEHIRYQITAVRRYQEARAMQMATLGWRASATNAPEQRVS